MNPNYTSVEVKVWGDYACFTRPEMKVERVSYEVPTPAAARGILEAIYWKPEFDWQIQEIVLLKPIKRLSIVRNEVKDVASENRHSIDILESHTPRHSLILKDVAYIIRAETVPRSKNPADYAKHRDIFRKRVRKGKCCWQPYLGCREFSAFFAETDGTEVVHEMSMGLGRMLFDIRYTQDMKKRGEGEPLFFPAEIQAGKMTIPQEYYSKLRS